MQKKEKVVLNYADLAIQVKKMDSQGEEPGEDIYEELIGSEMDRSRSNISAMNHESQSPRNRATSALTGEKQLAEWPASARNPNRAGLFNEELEQDGGDLMAFERSTPRNKSRQSALDKPKDQDSANSGS